MQREDRYTVLKHSDVRAALDADETETLIFLAEKIAAHRENIGKSPLECVVVEADWPEYQPTWNAIEARVDSETGSNAELTGDGLRSSTASGAA